MSKMLKAKVKLKEETSKITQLPVTIQMLTLSARISIAVKNNELQSKRHPLIYTFCFLFYFHIIKVYH
jgi:hypothetical protein